MGVHNTGISCKKLMKMSGRFFLEAPSNQFPLMQHIKSWEPYWKDVTVPAARRASADSGVTAQSLGLNPLGGGGFPLVLAHWFQMVLMSFQRRPRKRFRFLRRIIDFYVPLSEIAPRTLTLEVPCWVKSAVCSVRRPSRSQTYFSFQFLNRVKLWRSGVTDSAGEMETMPCLCLSCYYTIMSRRVTFVSYNMHVKSAVIFCICMKIISMQKHARFLPIMAPLVSSQSGVLRAVIRSRLGFDVSQNAQRPSTHYGSEIKHAQPTSIPQSETLGTIRYTVNSLTV